MKDDVAFIKDWHNSYAAVWQVGRKLAELGLPVSLPVSKLRPTSEERRQYMDSGDLEVTMRVEVKHRDISFTCADDYPYPTLYVDEEYKLPAQRRVSLLGYAIVNKEGTHCAFIGRASQKYWQVENRNDKAQQRVCAFVTVPKEHVEFFKL